METFSTPWTQLPTTTSCWGSAVPPKPAARRAPRAWLYHAWSRKGSKYPRASSESLKLLDIIKSHFINPPQYYLDLLSNGLVALLSCLFLTGSYPCVSRPYRLCYRHKRNTVVLTRFALRLHMRATLCVRSIYQMQSFMHEHTKQNISSTLERSLKQEICGELMWSLVLFKFRMGFLETGSPFGLDSKICYHSLSEIRTAHGMTTVLHVQYKLCKVYSFFFAFCSFT